MRRQYLPWLYLVISILLVLYGGYFTFYNYQKDQGKFISSIIVLSVGILLIVIYVILANTPSKHKKQIKEEKNEEIKSDDNKGIKVEENLFSHKEEKAEEKPVNTSKKQIQRDYDYAYKRASAPISYSGYLKELGYGPILDIHSNRIRDMRTNTYYRIEGNNVFMESSGLAYIIEGRRIKTINGNPLFEISGSNINKVFGGYYASISGNYITKNDLSSKFEMTSDFPIKYILVFAVLIFNQD